MTAICWLVALVSVIGASFCYKSIREIVPAMMGARNHAVWPAAWEPPPSLFCLYALLMRRTGRGSWDIPVSLPCRVCCVNYNASSFASSPKPIHVWSRLVRAWRKSCSRTRLGEAWVPPSQWSRVLSLAVDTAPRCYCWNVMTSSKDWN